MCITYGIQLDIIQRDLTEYIASFLNRTDISYYNVSYFDYSLFFLLIIGRKE